MMAVALLVLLLCLVVVSGQKFREDYDSYKSEIARLSDLVEPSVATMEGAQEEIERLENIVKVAKRDMILNKLENVKLGPRKANVQNNEVRKANNEHLDIEGHRARRLNDEVRSSDSTERLVRDKEELESRNNDIEDTVTSAIIELETQAREKAQAFRQVDSITDDLDVLEVKLAKAKKVVSREKKR
ncbi:hypothetical protein TrRE_jg8469 [Triparma retinervis]|uniref:Uncharacterized protein n=1 Tax=Triparma retinervis TaxID=2557542 RepID=A0A9W7AX19_9STRA|nr:hypothetical protein TrRE_jg8469 [Triparma retinervis]